MDLKYIDIIPQKVERIFIILHGYSANKELILKLATNFIDKISNT